MSGDTRGDTGSPELPDLATVRAYVKVPSTALPDDELGRMMAACAADQAARCVWTGDYPQTLAQAFLRRVQREIAARNLPLGMVGLDAEEYGPTRLTNFDALVEEHERAYRRVVLA